MSKATMDRMFEPFFTTKETGKGTGLGLATVFGIVQQSGGTIWAYSELEKGTALKIYFPIHREASAARAAAHSPVPETLRGNETILLVEDDAAVRAVTRDILGKSGYGVLEAHGSEDALARFETHAAQIDLLLTDVVMPQLSGRQLAEQLCPRRPTMKVLYMSGYTDDAVVRHGILTAGIAFLSKPVTPDALLRKVRQVLDSR
jgi:two-component system cell cycle sensor histidine kinase/response regulator CckA